MALGSHRLPPPAPVQSAAPPWQPPTWVKTSPTAQTRGAVRVAFNQHRLDLHDLKGDAIHELATRRHHFGQQVIHFYNLWKSRGLDKPSTNPTDSAIPFADWIEKVLQNPDADPQVASILVNKIDGTLKDYDKTKRDLSKRQRFIEGVRYMCKEVDRIKYLVETRGGQLLRRTLLFDTSTLSTHFSGLGWAIWVRAPNGNFYSHSHKIGRFHHSTFLAGGVVRGAGEWRVTAGKIVQISGKSGHYQPTMKALWESAHALNSLKVFDSNATVRLYKQDARHVSQDVKIGQFLATPWQKLLNDWVVHKESPEFAPSIPAPAPPAPVAPPSPSVSSATANHVSSNSGPVTDAGYNNYNDNNNYNN